MTHSVSIGILDGALSASGMLTHPRFVHGPRTLTLRKQYSMQALTNVVRRLISGFEISCTIWDSNKDLLQGIAPFIAKYLTTNKHSYYVVNQVGESATIIIAMDPVDLEIPNDKCGHHVIRWNKCQSNQLWLK